MIGWSQAILPVMAWNVIFLSSLVAWCHHPLFLKFRDLTSIYLNVFLLNVKPLKETVCHFHFQAMNYYLGSSPIEEMTSFHITLQLPAFSRGMLAIGRGCPRYSVKETSEALSWLRGKDCWDILVTTVLGVGWVSGEGRSGSNKNHFFARPAVLYHCLWIFIFITSSDFGLLTVNRVGLWVCLLRQQLFLALLSILFLFLKNWILHITYCNTHCFSVSINIFKQFIIIKL